MNQSDVAIPEDSEMFVMSGLMFGQDCMFTDIAPQPFGEPIAFHPRECAQTRNSGPRSSLHIPKDVWSLLLQEHPWLEEDDLPGVIGRRVGGGGSKPAKLAADDGVVHVERATAGPGVDDEGPVPEDGLDLPDVTDQLAAFRADNAAEHAVADHFFTRILGGAWTSRYRGVIADGIAAFPRAGEPKRWCTWCGWPRQFPNMYARYGVEAATKLAQEFVRDRRFTI